MSRYLSHETFSASEKNMEEENYKKHLLLLSESCVCGFERRHVFLFLKVSAICVYIPAGLNPPGRPPCPGLRAGTAAPAPGSSPTVPSPRPAAATSRAASSAAEAGPASLSGRSGTRPATAAFSGTNSGKPSHHESVPSG